MVEVRLEQVRMVGAHRRAVRRQPRSGEGEVTVARPRATVTSYVAATVALAAGAAIVAFTQRTTTFPVDLLAFIAIAALTDLREVRLPGIGHVTLSFVPVLAALLVFGLWPALIVAAVSGLATVTVTRDPEKVAFNVGDYVLSTFLAGLVYLALVPAGAGLPARVLPAFAATGVDFLANTVLLAGVVALAGGENPWRVWQRDYQWGLPSYLTGASLALLVAWLYLLLGVPGLIVGLPPLYLIYYSYEVYVGRARERVSHSAQVASFREELAATLRLQDELRAAQRKAAAEIERARRIQQDTLPHVAPRVAGLAIAQRIEFMHEMGGDYFDYLELPDGRLGIVCGDVMGKGLAAALIMTMARSVLHRAAEDGAPPTAVLAEVNDALTRDLEGQQAPCFLSLLYVVYDPATRRVTTANGGHNPLLLLNGDGLSQVPSHGGILGVRANLSFPEEEFLLSSGDTLVLYTDGVTEARGPDRELFGTARLQTLLEEWRDLAPDDLLAAVWNAVADFRDGRPPSDDATLLLVRADDVPTPRRR
jgi:serine phosphatase RsbU (regulator of sigma subunit)